MWDGFIIGAVFGFMLHRGGLVRYSRIIGTLLLKDFKAMNFMFTGLAVAALLYGVSDLLELGILPRINGYFGVGHIVGGVLFGIGMAIGGLCPGTCCARFGSGKILIGLAVLGLIAGALVYNALFPTLSGLGGEPQFLTLAMLLDVRYGYLALALGVMFLGMSFLLDRFDPAKRFDVEQKNLPLLKREWSWLPTGAIAGLLIFISTVQGEYLSFASGFLALAAHAAAPLGITLQSLPVLSDSTAWRAMLILGIIPGALLSSYLAGTIKQERVTPLFSSAFGAKFYLRAATVFLAGLLMSVGALTGGGCTTGAFMSAWPTLSVGSFVMGMAFFVTAMATARILYFRKYHLVHEVKDKEKLGLAND